MSSTSQHTHTSRRWFTLDRSDVALTYLLVCLFGIAAPLWWVITPVVDWITGTPLRWTTRTSQQPPGVTGTAPGIEAHWDGVQWSLTEADTSLRLIALAPQILQAALMVAGAVVLLRLLRASRAGRAFTHQTPARIATLGALIAGWGLSELLVGASEVIMTWEVTSPPVYEFRPDGRWLVAVTVGVIIMWLADVWRRAVRMRQDTEGLI